MENKYLKKGEKLDTLAKERYKKAVAGLNLSDFEAKIYKLELKKNFFDTAHDLAGKAIRPALRKANDRTSLDAFSEAVRKLTDIPFTLSDAKYGTKAEKYLEYKEKTPEEKILTLTLFPEDEHRVRLAGYKDRIAPKSASNVCWTDGSAAADIAEAISFTILLGIYDRERKQHPSTVLKACQEAYENVDLWTYLIGRSGIGVRRLREERTYAVEDLHEIAKDCKEIVLYQDPYHRPHPHIIETMTDVVEKAAERTVRERCIRDYKALSDLRLDNRNREKNFSLYLPSELNLVLLPVNPEQVQELSVIDYRTFLACAKEGWYFPLPVQMDTMDRRGKVVMEVLKPYWQEQQEKLQLLSYYKDLANTSDHAKSFQQKKAIPESTAKAMESSLFNNFFGHVEIDEDCDPAKVEEIAEEFRAFHDTFLPHLATEETVIRFRRLGNHHAAGLYYPSHDCICVDINNPHSLIHEYGHCIDYRLGSLSAKEDFAPIRDRYRDLIKGEESLKKVRGKYNLGYFSNPTEVFARCFEMYAMRTLGVSNSILREDKRQTFAYPTDQELMKKIDIYFSTLFAQYAEQAA